MKALLKKLFRSLGYDIVPHRWSEVPVYKNMGFDEGFSELLIQCQKFTMTSDEKMFALHRATKYLSANNISGDIVECGVAAGGSMMMAALSMLAVRDTARTLWLYDTFAGMPKPTHWDVNYRGDLAESQWVSSERDGHNDWCYFALDTVRENMSKTGYPVNQVRYVKGKVEDTIPGEMPEKIALLRLDTDWYESSKHELEHLYPRLCEGGVLLIDDYGHWEGCRKATDDYFADSGRRKPLFNRIDRLGVLAIKPEAY